LNVMSDVIKGVNFIKSSALNSRLFNSLCHNMDSEHQNLLYYTKVRWLSRGNVFKRVNELREEIVTFLNQHGQGDLAALWVAPGWDEKFAYLTDIFSDFNELNISMQGNDVITIDLSEKIAGFIKKLNNWQRKVSRGNLAMFHNLSKVDHPVSPALYRMILNHLSSLEDEFQRYFSDLDTSQVPLIRNPFVCAVDIIPDEDDDDQTELLQLQVDSGARIKFRDEDTTLSQFWISIQHTYPKLYSRVMRILIPFGSTYRCEAGFSALLSIKTKARNRLEVEDDLRCALSVTQPRITELVGRMQHQISH